MVQFVLISRVRDALPLCASMDTGKSDELLSDYQKQAKNIVKKLSPDSLNPLPTKASIKSGSFTFHYSVDLGVCFLVLCDHNYPKILAFSFLLEIQRSFLEDFTHNDIQSAMRPYHFLSFETSLQKTKKRYLNTKTLRTTHNMAELSVKLQSVRVLDIKAVLGAEYKPPQIFSTPQHTPSVSGSTSKEQVAKTRNMKLMTLSVLMAFVVLVRDFLPFFLWAKRTDTFNLLTAPTMEFDQGSLPVILQYVNLVSGLSAIYLLAQATAASLGHTWTRIPSMVYSLFVLGHTVLMVLVYTMTGDIRSPFYLFVAKLLPGLLLVAVVVWDRRKPQQTVTSNSHKD